MAIRKIRDHVLKPDKTTDIIHYESSADYRGEACSGQNYRYQCTKGP